MADAEAQREKTNGYLRQTPCVDRDYRKVGNTKMIETIKIKSKENQEKFIKEIKNSGGKSSHPKLLKWWSSFIVLIGRCLLVSFLRRGNLVIILNGMIAHPQQISSHVLFSSLCPPLSITRHRRGILSNTSPSNFRYADILCSFLLFFLSFFIIFGWWSPIASISACRAPIVCNFHYKASRVSWKSIQLFSADGGAPAKLTWHSPRFPTPKNSNRCARGAATTSSLFLCIFLWAECVCV